MSGKRGGAKRPSRRIMKNHLERLYAEKPICYYCQERVGIENRSVDHKIPLSKGGSTKADNLVLACLQCNGEKADMTDSEYAILREDKKYRDLIIEPYLMGEPDRTTFSLNLSYGR